MVLRYTTGTWDQKNLVTSRLMHEWARPHTMMDFIWGFVPACATKLRPRNRATVANSVSGLLGTDGNNIVNLAAFLCNWEPFYLFH